MRTLSKRVSETKAGVRNASLATGSQPVAENFHDVLEDLSWPMADESVADDFHEEPLDVPLLPLPVAVYCGRGVGPEASSGAPLGDIRPFHGLARMWGLACWLDRCGA